MTSMIVLPAGVAFANGEEVVESPRPDVSVSVDATTHSATEVRGGRGGGRHGQGEDHTINSVTGATTTRHGGYWSNPDNAEDVRGHDGVDSDHPFASSTASSTHIRGGDDNSRHGGDVRGNRIVGFLAWIFGQPDSTTIGDIKTQMQASTTLNTPTAGNSEGLGFFARLFGFFRHDN